MTTRPTFAKLSCYSCEYSQELQKSGEYSSSLNLRPSSHLLYKCAGLKSKYFKLQEKRERKIDKKLWACKQLGGGGVGAGGGGGADWQKERKKERLGHMQGTGSPNLYVNKKSLFASAELLNHFLC
jgi:hypothetical protein